MRTNKGRKVKYIANGGPYDGKELWLYSSGTMSFRVLSFDRRLGHYDAKANWVFDE